MQYQDNDGVDSNALGDVDGLQPTPETQNAPNNARNIQWTIIIGLVAAIVVAIFGSY